VKVKRRYDESPLVLLGIQWVGPIALKAVLRRPATNGNGAHEPARERRKRGSGLVRAKLKQGGSRSTTVS
jgi:hypothetical protein